MNVADPETVSRWIEINRPAEVIVRNPETGEPLVDENGQIVVDFVYEMVRDPGSDEPIKDDDGNFVWAPISTFGTELYHFDSDIIVDSAINDNEKENASFLAEQLLNSAAGTILGQVAPDKLLEVWANLAEGMKSSTTSKMAEALRIAAQRLQGQSEPVTQGGANNVEGGQDNALS